MRRIDIRAPEIGPTGSPIVGGVIGTFLRLTDPVAPDARREGIRGGSGVRGVASTLGRLMVDASSDIEISDIRDDAEWLRFAEIDAESFAGHAADNMRWLTAAEPHTTLRLARIGGEIVGGYMMLPTGEFFGGRSVPAQGISAVVVDAACRRRGVAGALMRDCVSSARDSGAALAPLFAATVRLYRRWGWEVCTQTFRQIVRTRALSGFRGAGTVRAHPDRASVEALRRSQLPRWDGPLDRPDWWLGVEWDSGSPDGHGRPDCRWSPVDSGLFLSATASLREPRGARAPTTTGHRGGWSRSC